MSTNKQSVVCQCDPDCLFVWLSAGMDKIEELRSAEEPNKDAIAKAIEDVRETISDIEMNLNWHNIKLNRAEIELKEY